MPHSQYSGNKHYGVSNMFERRQAGLNEEQKLFCVAHHPRYEFVKVTEWGEEEWSRLDLI